MFLDSPEIVCILLSYSCIRTENGGGGQTRWTLIFSSGNDFHHFPSGNNRREELSTFGRFLLLLFYVYNGNVRIVFISCQPLSIMQFTPTSWVWCKLSEYMSVTVRHASGSGWYMDCVLRK